MLPRNYKNRMFERMSNKTMRPHFHAVTKQEADGLVAEVLDQSEDDFFINGTITCHSEQPTLMAGMWVGGRESALVSDRLPGWLKIAMGATLSRENQCPYCEDMLVAMTHGARQSNVARSIQRGAIEQVSDDATRAVMEWVKASMSADAPALADSPFTPEQLPEAIGTLLTFSYTNKITDLTMYGSPVKRLKSVQTRVLGGELTEQAAKELDPGRALGLLPAAPLPADMQWAAPNPRVAAAVSRWAAAAEAAVAPLLPPALRRWLEGEIAAWRGGTPPMSRAWVEEAIAGLPPEHRNRARLILLVVKASYQVDDGVIDAVAAEGVDEAGLIALGAWAALSAARRVAAWTAEAVSVRASVRVLTQAVARG